MIDGIGKLRARLKNWGDWLNYEAEIAPRHAVCISIESRHIPEAGEVWEAETLTSTPDVTDAEAINHMIRQLDQLQQYALAVTYGGAPCVMRWRRVGEHAMQRSLDMAEMLLCEAMKKSA